MFLFLIILTNFKKNRVLDWDTYKEKINAFFYLLKVILHFYAFGAINCGSVFVLSSIISDVQHICLLLIVNLTMLKLT